MRCVVSRLLTAGAVLLVTCGLLCSGCAGKKEKPQTPEDYLRLGEQELSRKHEAQARKYYEQFLEQYPDSDLKAQAQFKIAEALYRERNYLEARFEYQKFLNSIRCTPSRAGRSFNWACAACRQYKPSIGPRSTPRKRCKRFGFSVASIHRTH